MRYLQTMVRVFQDLEKSLIFIVKMGLWKVRIL